MFSRMFFRRVVLPAPRKPERMGVWGKGGAEDDRGAWGGVRVGGGAWQARGRRVFLPCGDEMIPIHWPSKDVKKYIPERRVTGRGFRDDLVVTIEPVLARFAGGALIPWSWSALHDSSRITHPHVCQYTTAAIY